MLRVERRDECYLGLWGSLFEEVTFWLSPARLRGGDSPIEKSSLGWPRSQWKGRGTGSWRPKSVSPLVLGGVKPWRGALGPSICESQPVPQAPWDVHSSDLFPPGIRAQSPAWWQRGCLS